MAEQELPLSRWDALKVVWAIAAPMYRALRRSGSMTVNDSGVSTDGGFGFSLSVDLPPSRPDLGGGPGA